MKTKKINKKLSLHKKTIANLDNNEMNGAHGGGTLGTLCCIPTGFSICKCPTGDTCIECPTVGESDVSYCDCWTENC